MAVARLAPRPSRRVPPPILAGKSRNPPWPGTLQADRQDRSAALADHRRRKVPVGLTLLQLQFTKPIESELPPICQVFRTVQLGLDFALTRNSPVFCPSAGVTGYFPLSVAGTESQRLRRKEITWDDHYYGPKIDCYGPGTVNMDHLALTFDLVVPSLALLGMLLMGMSVITGSGTLLGISSVAMFISSASFAGYISAASISWLKYGRDILSPGLIWLIFSYLFGKLRLY